MSLPPFVYRHGVHTIQYLYDLFGYEQLLKEIEIIHHIHRSVPSEVHPPPVQEVVVTPPPIASEQVSEVKNIVVVPPNVAEENRCTATLSNGKPCTMRRKKSSEYCHRHHEYYQKQSDERGPARGE